METKCPKCYNYIYNGYAQCTGSRDCILRDYQYYHPIPEKNKDYTTKEFWSKIGYSENKSRRNKDEAIISD